MLIAIEGLDQSGKETQAQLLRDRLRSGSARSRVVSFPDYGTSIGEEIARALQGERDYDPEVMQLLYVANRYERKSDIERWRDAGLLLIFDRYTASSVAYGVCVTGSKNLATCPVAAQRGGAGYGGATAQISGATW